MARRFVILGNGIAGTTAALTLRERDPLASITLLGDESPWCFSRTALMYAFMGTLDRRAMEPFERRVYREGRIDTVFDRAVDLDADARVVVTARGRTLPWDALILATGASPRALQAPGIDRDLQGLVHFVSLRDLDACERWTPSTHDAVVVGGGLIGIELVECLVHHGVKTCFLVRDPWYWPAVLCREEAQRITDHLRARGVEVQLGVEVASVARDAQQRVCAVTTSRGDTLPCQMLGVAIGVDPAVAFLRTVKTPPALGRGVRVDPTLATSLEGVWAAGDCAEIAWDDAPPLVEQTWYAARRQGAHVARNLTGPRRPYTPPIFYNSAKLFAVECTTVGDLGAVDSSTRSLYRYHPTRPVSQRIVYREGRVVGFNMLGSRWDHGLLARWIEEARPLAWTLANLHQAQWDVEFGRVALHSLREVELPFTPLGAGS